MELNLTMLKTKRFSYKWLSFYSVSLLAIILSLCSVSLANANDEPSPEIQASKIKLFLTNPERDVGYTVGDVLTRKIRLEVQKPYRLIPTTLPIVGYERRYKNQVTGIEVRKISHSEESNKNGHTYIIDLEYQVFTTGPTAKPVALPAEVVKFQGAKKDDIVQYTIPSFRFRVSPLAVFGAVKIEYDMSTFNPPLLLQSYPEKQKLVACLITLAISLIGLLYILGSRAWMPLMGRPFANASRTLKKLKANEDDVRKGISLIHQALNTTAKTSVFNDSIHLFCIENQKFNPLEGELKQFFEMSHAVFFDTQHQSSNHEKNMQWLRAFCRQCRDCERGLVPSLKSTEVLKK
jgi:mxaA protein